MAIVSIPARRHGPPAATVRPLPWETSGHGRPAAAPESPGDKVRQRGGRSQVVKAAACGAAIRGFKSPRSPCYQLSHPQVQGQGVVFYGRSACSRSDCWRSDGLLAISRRTRRSRSQHSQLKWAAKISAKIAVKIAVEIASEKSKSVDRYIQKRSTRPPRLAASRLLQLYSRFATGGIRGWSASSQLGRFPEGRPRPMEP